MKKKREIINRKYKQHKNTSSAKYTFVSMTSFCSSPERRNGCSFLSWPSPPPPTSIPRLLQDLCYGTPAQMTQNNSKRFMDKGPGMGGWQEVPIQFQFPTREAIAPAQCGQKLLTVILVLQQGFPPPTPSHKEVALPGGPPCSAFFI